MSYPDIHSLVARKLYDMPDNWRPYRYEKILGGTVIDGAVCNAVYKSGPRRGEMNWKKLDKATIRKLVITDEQFAAGQQDYERSSGKCRDCGGDGKVCVRWSRVNGNEYGPCRRCSGGGAAPVESTP